MRDWLPAGHKASSLAALWIRVELLIPLYYSTKRVTLQAGRRFGPFHL